MPPYTDAVRINMDRFVTMVCEVDRKRTFFLDSEVEYEDPKGQESGL